jgi:hypothetical protein
MPALEATEAIIDGFRSPLGMELLAMVDWLLQQDGIEPNLEAVKVVLKKWPGGPESAERKIRLFDDRVLQLAIRRLAGER